MHMMELDDPMDPSESLDDFSSDGGRQLAPNISGNLPENKDEAITNVDEWKRHRRKLYAFTILCFVITAVLVSYAMMVVLTDILQMHPM